jgi:hypothetical protein
MDAETAYENLANAIVLQAVKDYRAAKRTGNSGRIASIRRFFRSDWFGTLTDVDGEYLIRKLDKEAENDNKGTVTAISPKQRNRA